MEANQTTENSVIFFPYFLCMVKQKRPVSHVYYSVPTLDFGVLKLCFGNSAPKETFFKDDKIFLTCFMLKSAKFRAYAEACNPFTPK